MSVEVKGAVAAVAPQSAGAAVGYKRNSTSSTGRSVSRVSSSVDKVSKSNANNLLNRSSIRVLPSSSSSASASINPMQKTETFPIRHASALPSRTLSPSMTPTCACSLTHGCSCSCTTAGDSPTPRVSESPPTRSLSPKIVPYASPTLMPSRPSISSLSSRLVMTTSTNNHNPIPPDLLPRRWITSDRLNELRKRTHEAIRNHKVFSIRGCFTTVRKALLLRGYVEKLDLHRKAAMALNLTVDEMLHQLPNRQPGETRRQYVSKCERNIISRFLEHTPVDFLWTFRKVRSKDQQAKVCDEKKIGKVLACNGESQTQISQRQLFVT